MKIQDSTGFDTTKLGFYPVENAVETVNNYWMALKLSVLWKPYSQFVFSKFTIFNAKKSEGEEHNVTPCNQIARTEFFPAHGSL